VLRRKLCFDSRKRRNASSAKFAKRRKRRSGKDWRKRHAKTGRGRDMAERRRSLVRAGQTFRGGSHRCRGTTTAQELDEDLSAALFSSFQRGDELN